MLSEQALSRVGQANGSDVVARLWLLVAPFVLGYAELFAPLWNDVIMGAVIASWPYCESAPGSATGAQPDLRHHRLMADLCAVRTLLRKRGG
jgi:hypothetical protein